MRTDQNAPETELQVLWLSSSTQIMPSIWKDVCSMWKKINHFKEVCRSGRSKMLHSTDPQREQHQDEDDIDRVNINSININSITLNSKCSIITANINTSTSQATSEVPYQVDSESNRNIMPFHILKKLYPRSTKVQLVTMKNENLKLGKYNSTMIPQLGWCKIKIENNNKIKKISQWSLIMIIIT